jgi:hypothetical protein
MRRLPDIIKIYLFYANDKICLPLGGDHLMSARGRVMSDRFAKSSQPK